MSDVATEYNVLFVNHYEEFDEPLETRFTAYDPEHVKTIVSALSAFYSGDPYECFINGDNAVLEKDWGLMEPPSVSRTGETDV